MRLREYFHTDAVPERNPLAVSLMLLIAFSLPSVALGTRPLPGSLDAADQIGQLAASILWVGSVAATIGMLWPRRRYGLAVEFLGVMWVAFGLIFYSYAVLHASTVDQARIAAALSMGIGLGCIARAGQIALFIRSRNRGPSRRSG